LIEELKVSVVILSDVLLPTDMQKELHVQADRAVLKGGRRTGSQLIPSRHAWSIRERAEISVPISEAMRKLLNRFDGSLSGLKTMRQVDPKLSVTFHIAIFSETADRVPLFLPAEILRAIVEFGANIDVEFLEAKALVESL
jgi:hypothetical protein